MEVRLLCAPRGRTQYGQLMNCARASIINGPYCIRPTCVHGHSPQYRLYLLVAKEAKWQTPDSYAGNVPCYLLNQIKHFLSKINKYIKQIKIKRFGHGVLG